MASCVVISSSVIAACIGIEHLSSTEQKAVVLNTTLIAFGKQQVNTTSAAQNIVVSPASGSGNSDDSVQTISFACSDFSVGGGLPQPVFRHCTVAGTAAAKPRVLGSNRKTGETFAGSITPVCQTFDVQTATFPVVFHPTTAGSASCQVFLSGTFGSASVTLTGDATLPPFVIDAQPGSVDFGDVRIPTTSRSVTVDAKNIGGMALTISSVSVDSGVGGPFTVTGNTGPHMLAPGIADHLDVTCTPPVAAANPITTNLRIVSNATNSPTLLIPLSCHGIDSALSSNPGSPVDLDTRVGEPITRKITVTNTGNAPSTVDAVKLLNSTDVTMSNVTPPGFPKVLTLNQSFSVDVTYPATTELAKIANGNLQIDHDGGNLDNVAISTEALATSLGALPDGVDFGPVCIGTGKQMPVKVFANLLGGFKVTAVGAPSSPMFSFTGSIGVANGGHTNDLTYQAGVMPTAVGVTTDTVMLTTDIPNAPTRDFALSVEGLPDGISASPTAVDYGTVDVGASTLYKSVKLTNCGTDPLMVTGATITGDAAADFLIVGSNPSPVAQTLAPTETEEIQIIMAPTDLNFRGSRTATLVIAHSAGETTAELDGTAIGDDPPAPEQPKGPETYYQCSSGGSGGALVGLAVLGIVIRRRRRNAA